MTASEGGSYGSGYATVGEAEYGDGSVVSSECSGEC